jgi:nicotinamidase-related amidase
MKTTGLLIIDIQNDYFPGGRFPLPGAPEACANAGKLLAAFRERKAPVIHVRHESIQPDALFFLPDTKGQEIHESLAPRPDEPVVVKHKPNSFLGTGLETVLRERGVETLVVCGMMTNMCVDAGVRAAADLGFACVLAHDACAAANLSFGGVDVPAVQVHAAFAAALGFAYAKVMSCGEYLSGSAQA